MIYQYNHKKTMDMAAAPVAVIFLTICFLSSAPIAAESDKAPRVIDAVSWGGTAELAAGAADMALSAVSSEVPVSAADTLLHLFKLGVVNAKLSNNPTAILALTSVSKNSAYLAPLAMEQLGDIALADNAPARAMTSYSSALKTTGLPTKYRQYLFAKVKAAANRGATLPSGQTWTDEYRAWERKQRLFDAVGLEAICDSLIRAGLLTEADSILERHLPEINRRDVCGVVDRMFKKRASDTTLATTKFLFALALQAKECRNFVTAERILNMARTRADFASVVPAKQALLLSADIAYGGEQWKKAIDFYVKYDAMGSAESDVLMNTARAYRNIGNAEQAQKWYDRHIKQFPQDSKTQEILWLRAWNIEENGQFRQAAAAYKRVFNTSGKRTEEAYIRHALCYYRMKEHDSVAIYLTAFQKKFPQSNYLWAGMFWRGKSLLAAKKADEAYKIWGDIARLDPTDYYAHRARQLMGSDSGSGWFISASPLATQVSNAQARAWLDSVSPSSKKKLTAKDTLDLRRGAALLLVARADIAEMFLGDYERDYGGNLRLQYEMSAAYAAAGNYALAFRVARRLAWRINMENRERVPLQVISILYPPYYSSVITPNAVIFGVDPFFISAVMRQESIFDKNIVSPAGATGLMQIMPTTGKGIAQELKESFTEDSLYSYTLNIRYGAFYLRKRLTQFGGDNILTLCSYNAGPHNAIKWRNRNRRLEYDLFVEDIGFFETRGYVKKVMGNYWTYKMLSDTPGYEYDMPLVKDEYPWVNDW